MSKRALFIRHKALPGKRDDVRRIWERYVRDYVSQADGQLNYFYCFDDTDPDAIMVFQLHSDAASGKAFTQQPWYADYEAQTAALLAGPSEFRAATPQWVKGG